MEPKTILKDLEDVAERLGWQIRYENLGGEDFDVSSGRYRLRGEKVILIDKRMAVNKKNRCPDP